MLFSKEWIMEKFLEWNPDLAESMVNCSHHYSDDVPNPWHLEDDVWSHTEMVLDATMDTPEPYNLWIPAMCHDIGKVYTRKLNHEKQRASFFGHENASIQPTVDFLHWLGINHNMVFTDKAVETILYVINNHMVFHKATIDTLVGYCNHNALLFYHCNHFALSDSKGRVSDIKEIRNLGFEGEETVAKVEDADIIFACGIPGSGKDYVAEKRFPDRKIVSFDNIRVDMYLKSFPKAKDMDTKELYSKAWEWSRKKVDLTAETVKLVKESLDRGVKVVVNTSCGIFSRRGLIHSLRGLGTMSAIFVVVPLYVALERNRSRSSKTIPEDAVVRFSRKISLPTESEGFIAVEVIQNT